MIGLFCFALAVLGSPFKSKLRLEAENAVLRHQLIVLKRRLHGRFRLTDQAALGTRTTLQTFGSLRRYAIRDRSCRSTSTRSVLIAKNLLTCEALYKFSVQTTSPERQRSP